MFPQRRKRRHWTQKKTPKRLKTAKSAKKKRKIKWLPAERSVYPCTTEYTKIHKAYAVEIHSGAKKITKVGPFPLP